MRSLAAAFAIWALATPAVAHCSFSTTRDKQPRFEIAGGEVIDRATGLIWRRCSIGLEWDGRACAGTRADVNHEQALAAAEAAGAPWRLPTIKELSSLIDRGCGRPAIDATAFPDVTASSDEGAEEYWSSTPGNLNDMIWFVEFADGYRDIRSPGFQRSARLVRSAP